MPDTLFYFPNIQINKQLPEEESHHIVRVLRMNEGDAITISDGKGYFYDCRIIQAHPKHCMLEVEKKYFQSLSWNFTLEIAFAPTKNMDRNEWFCEKATEIGINSLIPFKTDFSERKEIKTERLKKISIAAMKQSKQSFLPNILEMKSFDEVISKDFLGQKFIAHCYKFEKKSLATEYKKGNNALILIGPEGDFSEEEVQKAIRRGFTPISLGENRLRTETACLAACHTIHVINQL